METWYHSQYPSLPFQTQSPLLPLYYLSGTFYSLTLVFCLLFLDPINELSSVWVVVHHLDWIVIQYWNTFYSILLELRLLNRLKTSCWIDEGSWWLESYVLSHQSFLHSLLLILVHSWYWNILVIISSRLLWILQWIDSLPLLLVFSVWLSSL